jgi:RILP-like protein 1
MVILQERRPPHSIFLYAYFFISQELEAIEDQWRSETRELLGLVSRLQEQNKKLQKQQTAITPTDNTLNSSNNPPESPERANDGQILQKLKTQVEQLRNELKTKDRDLQEKISHEDHLSTQMERLKNSGRESRRRQKLLQSQIQTLCEERADFLAQLQDQHRDLMQLKKQLGIAEKENEDLTSSQFDDNPDRPRYTTAELKEVLSERNELKTKIIEMEEELMALRPIPEKQPNTADSSTPNADDDDPPVQVITAFFTVLLTRYLIGFFLHLIGSPSVRTRRCSLEAQRGIGNQKVVSTDTQFFLSLVLTQSFSSFSFRKLFSESDSGSPSSFRSLSTLSKMALSSGPHSDIPI